jgi:hypothetical protein
MIASEFASTVEVKGFDGHNPFGFDIIPLRFAGYRLQPDLLLFSVDRFIQSLHHSEFSYQNSRNLYFNKFLYVPME